ncbi:MAG TPA: SgcJ/EcaC family oxidoreductase [Candidatus Dormibacteraeota bacterium]|nr:SgcJ/EcaC family oxidoreductase [Candidatus Dormibacteraeota bacterium]
MSDTKKIEEMLDRYRTAVHDKDVESFLSLYDDEVTVFDMWGRWAYRGLADWRAMATEWFGSLGADLSSPEFHDVRITAGDGVAAAHAFLTYRGLSADGKELRAMDNRITWVLRRNHDGEWKIIHEHTSAPADFGTGKVTLKR